ncbi:MAG: fasciclin domain-containing protein [Pseudomonadota bacterium]
MFTRTTLLAAAAALPLMFGAAQAQDNPTVGGATMLADQPIAVNASNAPNLTTLVAAVTAAGLVDTLAGDGPFTVFAPTNAAFAALPAGTVDTLLQPENKGQLTKVLLSHVVPGRLDAQSLVNQISRAGGRLSLETASGNTIVLSQVSSQRLGVTDESGNTVNTRTFDVFQSNGVVHVIDGVLLPQ